MSRLVMPVVVVLLAAGCSLNGDGHGASATSSPPPSSAASEMTHAPPPTRLVFVYALGQTAKRVSQLDAPCPRAGRCTFTHGPLGWLKVVHLRLTCSPDGGDHADPARACAAFADLWSRRTGGVTVCGCPAFQVPARVTGTYIHRRVEMSLDGCSLCGLGKAAAADAAILMPHR